MIEVDVMASMIRSLETIVAKHTGLIFLTVAAYPDNIVPVLLRVKTMRYENIIPIFRCGVLADFVAQNCNTTGSNLYGTVQLQ